MKKEFVIALLFIFLMSFTVAKIAVTEPQDVYNFGDKIYVTVTTIPASITGFFEITLVCGNASVNLYKVPAESSFSLREEQTISTNILLTPEYIGNLMGVCSIHSSIGKEEIATKDFTISNDVILTPTLDKTTYNPGETITLELEAIKANLKPLKGFVEVTGGTEFTKVIDGGFMTEQFAMAETAEAGTYTLNIFAYDRGANNSRLNQKNASVSFEINQVPSFIQISLSELDVTPEEEFSIGTDIFDQSGKQMEGITNIKILSPSFEEKEVLSITSGEVASITFLLNETPGTWEIYATFLDIIERKEFTLKEIQKVELEFVDSIMIVKNVGNTRYNKTIEVKIGTDIRELELNMDIGEKRKFNLNAPNGEYDVEVMTDNEDVVEKRLLLTGRVISIEDVKGLGQYPLAWIFIIIVLVAIALVIYFKFRKKEFRLQDRIRSLKSRREQKKEDKMLDVTKPKINEAESSLVLNGEKNNSSIISIKLKKELNQVQQGELKNILSSARQKKGMVDWRGDEILIVFSPLITKTFDNERLAVRVGFEIFQKLNSYNKKSAEKIGFNIGINSGDLIASIKDKKLRYTSVGSTIILAKKLANSSSGELLVTDTIRNKLLRELKVKKVSTPEKQKIFSVESMNNNSQNQEKLEELLKRMGKG